jgi:hypothetical protein
VENYSDAFALSQTKIIIERLEQLSLPEHSLGPSILT